MALIKYRLAVKRSNRGLGLFTLQRIPAGKRIIEFVGTIIINEEVKTKGGRYLFGLDDGYAIDGSSRRNTARYINHSCEPNAEAFISGRHIWIWSRRTLEAREEITIDYAPEYFEEFIGSDGCKCERCAA